MTTAEILRRLGTKTFGRNTIVFESLDSTNIYAKSIAGQAPEGTLVIAEHQLEGKGRLGRRWHSTAGRNLTFSLIIRPSLSPRYAGLISLFAALGVAKAMERKTKLVTRCKWPNDVLVDGRKISGILSEAIFAPDGRYAVIIGIGVNVLETSFPPEVKASATSITLASGREFDRIDILCGILEEFEALYPMLTDEHRGALVAAWSAHSSTLGATVDVTQDGHVMRGIARHVTEDGRLAVENAEGMHYVLAGDTSFV